jgi:hypothetical protein
MFDITVLDRCPPEPAAEPACRACTILLDPLRPGRRAIDLPDDLGQVCSACYDSIRRHQANGLTIGAALAAATWGTAEIFTGQ